MESLTLRPDLLIVGAGVAGSALMMACARAGVNALLVERAAGPRPVFKGEYLQPGAVAVLRECGFRDLLDGPFATRVHSLEFQDLDEAGKEVAGVTIRYPAGESALALEHHALVDALHRELHARVGEGAFWRGAELRPLAQGKALAARPAFRCVRADGSEVKIEPRWVVGADGRQSSVRRWLGGAAAASNGHVVRGAPAELILGALAPERSRRPDHYRVIRRPGLGTLSLFSVGEAGQRLYLSAPDLADGQRAPQKFARALAGLEARLELGAFNPQARTAAHPANTEWLGPARFGRVLLAGDALAVTTPYGGQGMTQALEHVGYLARAPASGSGKRVPRATAPSRAACSNGSTC